MNVKIFMIYRCVKIIGMRYHHPVPCMEPLIRSLRSETQFMLKGKTKKILYILCEYELLILDLSAHQQLIMP